MKGNQMKKTDTMKEIEISVGVNIAENNLDNEILL